MSVQYCSSCFSDNKLFVSFFPAARMRLRVDATAEPGRSPTRKMKCVFKDLQLRWFSMQLRACSWKNKTIKKKEEENWLSIPVSQSVLVRNTSTATSILREKLQ